jgi:hypothetical protein
MKSNFTENESDLKFARLILTDPNQFDDLAIEWAPQVVRNAIDDDEYLRYLASRARADARFVK